MNGVTAVGYETGADSDWEPEACRSGGPKLTGRIEARVFNHINGIHTSGHFAISGNFGAFPTPGISVQGLGPLRLPVSPDDVEKLFTRFARESCKGAATSRNRNDVLHCEVEAVNISFDNPIWLEFMRSLVRKVRQELGVYRDVRRVRAKLCKMYIRRQGSPWSLEQYTCANEGVFGTLLVNLPSGHQGGQALITYKDCTETFTTAESSNFGVSYMAHYNDSQATHFPLLTGYQCTMIYHLCQNPNDSCLPTASKLDEKMERTDRLLMQWYNKPSRRSFMVYPLNHSRCRLHDEPRRNVHRVRHIARYCRNSDMFCVLIADIKVCDYTVEIKGIRDLNNVSITNDRVAWKVCEDIRMGSVDCCCGSNRHEGLLIVPKQELTTFFIRVWDCKKSYELFECRRRLQYMLSDWPLNCTDFDFGCSVSQRELHYSICEAVLRMEKGDEYVGVVAVHALRSRYNVLFSKVVRSITECLSRQDWNEIGEQLNLQNPPVDEQLIIQALTKGHAPANVYRSIRALNEGLRKQKAEHHELIFRQGWLHTVMLHSLNLAKTISILDVDAIVDMVTDAKDERSMRQLITYQTVRKTTMAHVVGPVATSMAFKLCQCLDSHEGHRSQLLRLLQIVTDAAISHFEPPVRDGRVWLGGIMSYDEYKTGCTLASFYHHIDDPIHRAKLLEKIRRDTCIKRKYSFLSVFLKQIIESEAPIPDECQSTLFEIFFVSVKINLETEYTSVFPTEQLVQDVRPSFTHQGYGECNCVRDMCRFLLEPGDVASRIIDCTNPTQPAWQSDGWRNFRAELPVDEEGVTSLIVHKRYSNFTGIYRKVMEDLDWIHELDQRKLRNALGDLYEDTLALWLAHQ